MFLERFLYYYGNKFLGKITKLLYSFVVCDLEKYVNEGVWEFSLYWILTVFSEHLF